MTDLLTPEEVQETLTANRGGLSPWIKQLCRNYLTLWDELQNERGISDRLRQRIVEEEGPSK